MTSIKPFKAICYNRETIKNLSKVVTPPYDVIPPRDQARYYRTHPYNFIRLILGKDTPKDTKTDNRYTRAKRFFEGWLKEGVLVKEAQPSIYIYDQEYSDKGKNMSRLGFISLAKLEEDRTKGFLPHERTFSGPKADRFKLIKQVRANLSPIFSVIFDDNKRISRILKDFIKTHNPIIDMEFEGTRNKLWRISDARTAKRLSRLMRSKQALIADGHHRYEVALAFRRAMRRAGASSPKAYDYVMMYFAISDAGDITILPTHRMVSGISSDTFRKNMDKIREFFDIIYAPDRDRMFSFMETKGPHVIGLYLGGKKYLCLSLKGKAAHTLIRSRRSARWRSLDVVILHKLILERVFGLKGRAAEEAINFTRDPKVAFRWVNSGRKRAAFFLNPPALEDIKGVAKSNERMPHKTTYFYPKPLSGLVINKFS